MMEQYGAERTLSIVPLNVADAASCVVELFTDDTTKFVAHCAIINPFAHVQADRESMPTPELS